MASHRPPTPIARERPAEGEAHELLGFERVMLVLRLLGGLVVVTQAPLYSLGNPALIGASLAIILVSVLVQRRLLNPELSLAEIRRRSIYLLAADLAAVYLIGTAFAAEPDWVGFYFYPLMSLEAAIVAGLLGGGAVTVLNLLVYVAQLVLHVQLGNRLETHSAIAALSLVGVIGGAMTVYAVLAQRGQRDLRVLLDLTSALAHQQAEAETIELLDRRLYDAIGARVRSIAVRDVDNSFQIVRWHSAERRTLSRQAIEQALGDVDELSARFAAGTSLTWEVDAWSVISAALGLPEWTRGVTLVPIFVEGQWVGVLPVLWPSATTPTHDQLRLLYGLASQVGLALAQGQLQRVREEAATDPLTGLLNRRAILDELATFVARARRGNGRLAVLFCDLDGFKAVNDRGGHEAGDRTLRVVAGAVRNALRQGDVVGRIGGDELLVIAGDAAVADAMVLANRIGGAVRATAGADGLDISIGIAAYPADAVDADALLAASDQAMYRGKTRGPGRVTLAGVPEKDDLPHPGS
jgi:diguanylate cyclase (GGDEF)-like protein